MSAAELPPVIVWFRRDLRLADNPALAQAAGTGRPVVLVYIHDEAGEGAWPAGGASRWWLRQSLQTLAESCARLGSPLILRSGSAATELAALCAECGATEAYWNRRYEPTIVARDTAIKKQLAALGVQGRSFNGSLLHSPLQVANKTGQPFKVFTPFWKSIRQRPLRPLADAPTALRPFSRSLPSVALDALGLAPRMRWHAGLAQSWRPGESGARAALDAFAEAPAERYAAARDFPAESGVSRLSPFLHYGEISPAQIWTRLDVPAREPYLRQLAWREFAHHLLYHFPSMPMEPLRPEFAAFPWRPEAEALRAWQTGQTGYPIVDAGMRELWRTGWMHNRVRMIAASFLVKHMLQPWQSGAAWFWDTLVDADLANNAMGWQWVAGCGADAAPYFRIFNPIAQGERFDPEGHYTRRWLPELARLPNAWLFKPWEAPETVRAQAGIELGSDYPAPIVQHDAARAAALAAYRQLRSK